MILELDAGNSSLKWRLVNPAGEVALRGRQDYSEDFAAISQQFTGMDINTARVACVAGEQAELNIKSWLNHLDIKKVIFARTLKNFSGLQIAYDDPQRLGVDRWLAMLAAWTGSQPCCVIDCGSAITVDLINAQGKHIGGYIVPGLRAMRLGLLAQTGKITMDPVETPSNINPGVNTNEAVNNGILRMTVSFVQSVLTEVGNSEDDWHVVTTGGDMEVLNQYLTPGLPVRHVPELVLDGLEKALG